MSEENLSRLLKVEKKVGFIPGERIQKGSSQLQRELNESFKNLRETIK